jgi:methionyl aminopeptidase
MDKETLNKYVRAGEIAAECLKYGESLIKAGAIIREVLDKIEEKIIKMRGEIAFPAQSCINSVAAHYCPAEDDNTAYKEGDVVKLDIGVHIEGFVADTALSVNLGDHDDLVKASQEALNNALKIIRPGIELKEIGRTIQETISSYNLSPIRNLSGHGLGPFLIHTKPTVPNFNNNDDTKLKEDQVIAVEPFASTGAGMIYESSNPTLFALKKAKPVRNLITRKVMNDLKQYNGLPFTSRWLTKKHGIGKVNFALRELDNTGCITKYPPLPDKNKGLVSQAEHSVIVKEKLIIFTKR